MTWRSNILSKTGSLYLKQAAERVRKDDLRAGPSVLQTLLRGELPAVLPPPETSPPTCPGDSRKFPASLCCLLCLWPSAHRFPVLASGSLVWSPAQVSILGPCLPLGCLSCPHFPFLQLQGAHTFHRPHIGGNFVLGTHEWPRGRGWSQHC